MKVLIVASKSENGGAPKAMMEIVDNVRKNYNVEYTALLHKEGKTSGYCRDNGIEYCIDGHEPIAIAKGSTKIRRLAKLILRPLFIYKASKRNRQAIAVAEKNLNLDEFDIIHTNSNRDGIGAMIAEKYGIPHIWHLREFGEEDYDTTFLPPYNVDFMNRNTTRFIAISKAVEKTWKSKKLDASKICHIYDGVDLNLIISDPERKQLKNKELKMAFTGTVCPAKGQSEIIEAIGRLSEEEKKLVSVDFYGEGVPKYISTLKKRAEALGFGDRVNFLGHCDDIGARLKNYSVGLVCSRSEAFGRITPEYMSAGLIAIACDTGSGPELIDDGKTGFLYHRSDFDDFARLIKKVLNMTADEKISISHAAEQYARESFTAERNAENIYRLYKEVADKK